MQRGIIAAMVGFSLVVASLAIANPDGVVVRTGDLRISESGAGIVFPDGSVQTKATVQGPQGPVGPAGPAGQGLPVGGATISLPQFSSANSATFTPGSAGSFSIIGTGTFSVAGILPPGVTFNATNATLSGTPAIGSSGTYPLVITALSNGFTVTQAFTLNVSLSPDQSAFESFSLSPNQCCLWTYTFTPSTGTFGYFISSCFSLAASPLTNGPQKVTSSAWASVARTLSVPSALPSLTAGRYVVGGKIVVSSSPIYINNISYQGDTVLIDVLATDGATIVYTYRPSNIVITPLVGTVAAAPTALTQVMSSLYSNASLLNPAALWGAGAVLATYVSTYINDVYQVLDNGTATVGDAPTPYAANTTISDLITAGTLTNGAVSVINGVNTFVSSSPINNAATSPYRTYYDINGNVYIGYLYKAGTVQSNSINRLNGPAIQSIRSALTF
jgi:hypothetical protein